MRQKNRLAAWKPAATAAPFFVQLPNHVSLPLSRAGSPAEGGRAAVRRKGKAAAAARDEADRLAAAGDDAYVSRELEAYVSELEAALVETEARARAAEAAVAELEGAARASDAERREERRVAKARRDDGGRLREAHAENERLQEGVRSLQQKAEALIATNDELMRTNGSLHAQLRAAGRLGAGRGAGGSRGASPPRLASPPRGGRSGALEPLHTEMLGVGERPPWKPWRRSGAESTPERAQELGPEGTVAMLRSMIDE